MTSISSSYYHMQNITAIWNFFFNYNTSDQDISTNDYTLGRKRNTGRATRTRSYSPSAVSYSSLIESGNRARAEPEVIFHQPQEYFQAFESPDFYCTQFLNFFLPKNSSQAVVFQNTQPPHKTSPFYHFPLKSQGTTQLRSAQSVTQ